MRFLLLSLLLGCVRSESILQRLGFGEVEELGLLYQHHDTTLARRQNAGNSTCRLTLQTDIWNSCAGLLSQFNLTLDYFMGGNPSIGANCSNFVPGSAYCIYWGDGTPVPVSTSGMCGVQQNWTNTCIGSQWGDCCGVGGYCGTGDDFCGLGNCQEGTCEGAPIPYSTNGLCGSQNSYVECPPKFGLCCSEFGFCGNGSDYCNDSCQSGPCGTATSTTSVSAPTQTPGSVSADGTCGFAGGLICTGSRFGNCCSAAGICGSSQYECLDILGCQDAYGSCTITGYLSASETSTTSTLTTSAPTSTSGVQRRHVSIVSVGH